ncbi:MAG: phosphoenolpyruvate-protein phosphotransferase PtsI [Ktedonobacteraceae bacterium]
MKVLRGIPAAPGLVIGPTYVVRPAPPVDISKQRTEDAPIEVRRLEQAIAQSIAHLSALLSTTSGSTYDMLTAQNEMLDDPELKQGAITLITDGFTAEAAITRVATEYAEQLASLPDPYLAARADDVREVSRRIVSNLRGTHVEMRLDKAVILVAQDLAPAETVELNPAFLQAIVTEAGSATGHLAIVAQGLGIPAVVGVSDMLKHTTDDTTLIVDGDKGIIIIDPDATQRHEAETHLQAVEQERNDLHIYRDSPGMTADGVRVEVFANIGSVAEAQKAVEMGAEGVGLFRTEFIAVHGLPSEEAQHALYEEVATALQRPLVVRTFDIGGDKPVPGLDMTKEANPFLGWRGIRMGLDRPEEVFLPQIRALLRVSSAYDVRIMLPMVTVPQEVEDARTLIEQARKDLEREGRAPRSIQIGIMVETPAAALTLDQFKGLIDFASIGTNDLTQYTYAVDRTNARVQERAKPLGIAMLRLIAQVCQVGIPIAVCGQLAGNSDAIPLLVGLGVRELSVAPTQVPTVKHLLSTMTLAAMQAQVQQVLGK